MLIVAIIIISLLSYYLFPKEAFSPICTWDTKAHTFDPALIRQGVYPLMCLQKSTPRYMYKDVHLGVVCLSISWNHLNIHH